MLWVGFTLEQAAELVLLQDVALGAELARHLGAPVVGQHRCDLPPSHRQDGDRDALAAAAAAEADVVPLQQRQIVADEPAEDVRRAQPLTHQLAGRCQVLDAFGDGIERALAGSGERLDEVASRGHDPPVDADEDTDTHRRRRLLRVEQVSRQVGADLARLERDDAAVERARGDGDAHDAQHAATERTADVELAGARRQVRGGMHDVAARVAVGCRIDEHAPQRAVPAELERQALVALDRAGQEQGPRQRAAERRRGGRRRLVAAPSLLDQVGGDRRERPHRSAVAQRAREPVSHAQLQPPL